MILRRQRKIELSKDIPIKKEKARPLKKIIYFSQKKKVKAEVEALKVKI